MITELRIADLGVINDATISPHPGLTVVTGETGAGKTMIISGLGLLLGGRADPRSVRRGSERARVEGRFKIENPEQLQQVNDAGGELDDDELIVARHLTSAGRSRAYLGGAQVPASVCAEMTATLVRIHGQAEQERLTGADRQRQLLDRFAGAPALEPLARYSVLWAEDHAVRAELGQLRTESQRRAREIDLLRFGLDEIERIAPAPGEDVALAAETVRLQSADDLRDSAQAAVHALAGPDDEAGGALAMLSAARKAFDAAVSRDPAAMRLGERLADVGFQLSDVTADLARYLDSLESEPGRLEQIAERRAQLNTLTRKYGASCDEVLQWAAESAVRLTQLEQSDDRIATLERRVEELKAELTSLAAEIGAARRSAATKFSELVLAELAALAMPHARLNFDVTSADLGPSGADRVDLMFSANPGSEVRSLGRVASGGELSRVRLALEAVLAGQWLHAHADDLDLVVCSPATRARQTWKQVARQYSPAPELRVEERLYAATEQDLVVVLKELPAPLRTVLLVGHNPGLEDVVAHLTGVWCPLKTSSIAVLSSRSAWADARFRWGRLDTSITPRA